MVQTAKKYKADVSAMAGITRPNRLKALDGRTREARRLRIITDELTTHAGGADRISAPLKYLIARTATDILRLEMSDRKMAMGETSDHDSRVGHALRNSVRLALKEIGMKPAAPRQATLAEHLASIEARGGAA
jgi:hypothetical protein